MSARLPFLCGLAGLLAAGIIHAETRQQVVSFAAPEARLWLGQTQVVPVKLSGPAAEKMVLPTVVSPAGTADVVEFATILPGENTGFLRLRGLKAGKATLQVGDRSLKIDIVSKPAGTAGGARPSIISPPSGACLYGTVTAGVELNAADPRAQISEPRLVLPDGRELAPRARTISSPGATLLYAFDINADELPAGPAALQTYVKDEQGRRTMGDPVAVTVICPDPSKMISGLCVDRINDPRPARFGEKLPRVEKDQASPEGFINNHTADPAWCFQETVEEAGLYQLTMRVRGRASAGAFPSVGVLVNDGDYALAASRLVDAGWHRIPIGGPIRLDAGGQILTARFLNDFAQGKSDRNLHLERYELVRIDGGSQAYTAGDDASMMGGGDSMMMQMGDAAQGDASLRVSFSQRLDNRVVRGPLTLRANVWRPQKSPPAIVDLVVNGRVAATQQGNELIFRVPVGALEEGSNSLQLRARTAQGLTASSPVENVRLGTAVAGKAGSRVLRFTVQDRAWDPGMAQRLDNEKPPAAFYSNGEAVLALPEDLAGEFTVQMEARGQGFKGPPIVEAFYKPGEQAPEKIGEVAVGGDKSWTLGKLRAAEGPKQIILRFSNDKMVKGQGDRNWWLRALTLEEARPPDPSPARVEILYPPAKEPLALQQATVVVAKAFHPDGLEWLDLVIDGKPQNLRFTDEDGLGRFVLPLVVSALPSGNHKWQLLARDRNGRETASAEMPLRVTAKPQPADRAYARAVLLLNRFAYGPEPEEMADVLLMGGKNWLKDRLAGSLSDAGEQAAWQRAWNENADPLNKGQVVPRVLSYLLRTPNPARARFVLWTQNHFSTWLEKADALNKWDEHVRFLELGPAPFGDLLMASATSPAMLVYLDQNKSYAKKLNENYAREVMELHTVGVKAGYKQEDVTSLASILTGWTLSSDAPLRGPAREMSRTFRYEPLLNNPAGQRVFGMEFAAAENPGERYDRTLKALEMLAARPETAGFISRKLAEHYVSVPAPASLVKKLTARFLATGGDMTALLLDIAGSPEFAASASRPKLATPLDFSLRLARLVGPDKAGSVRDFLRKSGAGLFDRATPDGYPEADAAYASSNALLQRWNFVSALSGNLRRLMPAAMLPAPGTPWDRETQRAALDVVSMRLTGQPLTAGGREAAAKYLDQVFTGEADRPKVVASFVAQLPQSSLR